MELCTFNTGRIEHLYFDEWIKDMYANKKLELYYSDMTDSNSLFRIIQFVKFDELYNLEAQCHVKVSIDVPEYIPIFDTSQGFEAACRWYFKNRE